MISAPPNFCCTLRKFMLQYTQGGDGMTKNDKIYRIVSIFGFILHIFVFVFVAVVGFLPFRNDETFYELLVGFFGDTLSVIHPYLLMAILLLSCVMAYFAIKRPWVSLLILASTFLFFGIVFFPIAVEGAMLGFASTWLAPTMPAYHNGLNLVNGASHIIYFDIAFVFYSLATSLLRSKKFID